jgi:hypothetical protein
MLDFITKNEGWLTYASDEEGTKRAWRCQVADRHFPTPDIRERCGASGYGKTAREAIESAMVGVVDKHVQGIFADNAPRRPT